VIFHYIVILGFAVTTRAKVTTVVFVHIIVFIPFTTIFTLKETFGEAISTEVVAITTILVALMEDFITTISSKVIVIEALLTNGTAFTLNIMFFVLTVVRVTGFAPKIFIGQDITSNWFTVD